MDDVSWFGARAAKVFATTRWSLVAACLQRNHAKADRALSELCHAYWRPIYACIRHQGYSVHDAQDLTQEFFAHLLKGKWLHQLDASKGRFRSYLSVALRHFLISQHRRRWTFWRGWGSQIVSFDVQEAEGCYLRDSTAHAPLDEFYERQWAVTLVENALGKLRLEMIAKGKKILCGYFDVMLEARSKEFPYKEVARSLDISLEALHASLGRWRRRFRQLLREEIGRTVTSKSEIEAELVHLQHLTNQKR